MPTDSIETWAENKTTSLKYQNIFNHSLFTRQKFDSKNLPDLQ